LLLLSGNIEEKKLWLLRYKLESILKEAVVF